MRKTIPAKEIVFCDACGAENPPRVLGGAIAVRRHALDFHGTPCADGSSTMDICDDCLPKLIKVINEACAEIYQRRNDRCNCGAAGDPGACGHHPDCPRKKWEE